MRDTDKIKLAITLLLIFLAVLILSGCSASKVKRTFDQELGIACYSTWNKMECFQTEEPEEEIDEDDTYELAKGEV